MPRGNTLRTSELPTRPYLALRNCGFSDDATSAEIFRFLPEMRTRYKRQLKTGVGSMKNFGHKSMREVEEWLTSQGHNVARGPQFGRPACLFAP